MNLEVLPDEILLKILSYLPLSNLLTGIGLANSRLYNLIRGELSYGRLPAILTINARVLQWCETETTSRETGNDGANHRLEAGISDLDLGPRSLDGLELVGFQRPQQAIESIKRSLLHGFPRNNEDVICSLRSLLFSNCVCDDLSLSGFPDLNSVSFSYDCQKIPTRLYQELASARPPNQIWRLEMPKIPAGFVPLVLSNQSNITVLEIGEVTNQVVYMVCKILKNLSSFSFVGNDFSYSGVIGLSLRKDTLRHLAIRDPKYLTKHSMALISNQLTKLKTLKLFWLGKLLINNPWSFDFCLDREEQRVDNLFSAGNLKYLENLELSAFYQTVDDKVIQTLCAQHLSSVSLTDNHLKKIVLSHCYRVSDAGLQWLVGSCHSPGITELNLSNTNITGGCFLRKLPNLTRLNLECCGSLSGQGLQNIAASCPNLVDVNIAMNKQLSDEDLNLGFKNGLQSLQEFNASYTNINGSCLKNFRSTQLQKLVINSCSKIKDETGLDAVLHRNPDLKHLDLSATGISGSVFKNIENPLRRIRELYLDFCPKLDLQMLKQELAIFPGLKMISIFGIAVEQTGDLRFDHHELREIVTSSGEETEEEIRTFANYRRLRLNNWMVTKKHLFKGVPMLFSQINLTSFADRDHS